MTPTQFASLIAPVPSDELAEAGNRTDDLADGVFAHFLAGVGNDFARDRLHLLHAEAGGHQLGAHTHDPAHADAPIVCRLHGGIRSGHPANELSNLVGRTFLEQESQNNSNRLLGHAAINADICDETVEKFVHGPTPFKPPHLRRLVSIISTSTQEDKASATLIVRNAARMLDSLAMRCMKVTTRIWIGGFALNGRDAYLGAARLGGAMSQALTQNLPQPPA